MARVVMFVYNDCKRDQRVLREATTLTAAGHRVTIMAHPSDPWSTVGDQERRDGFEIVRVPIPDAWRSRWQMLRYPWRAGRDRLNALIGSVRGRRFRPIDGAIVPLLVLLAAWSVVRLPFYALERRRRRAGSGTLDWLVRWRFGILGWGRDVALAAPPADVWHGHDLTGL